MNVCPLWVRVHAARFCLMITSLGWNSCEALASNASNPSTGVASATLGFAVFLKRAPSNYMTLKSSAKENK